MNNCDIPQQKIDDIRKLHHVLFDDSRSINEALAYAYAMKDPRVATAVHVVVNAIAKHLQTTDEEDE